MKSNSPSSATKGKNAPQAPNDFDWRTTDYDEIQRRRARALAEQPRITNLTPEFPVHSNFRVSSKSGMVYQVELRDLAQNQRACQCVDFRTNGLGTCKHVEAVLLYVAAKSPKAYKAAEREDLSPRIDIVPDLDRNRLVVERNLAQLPAALRRSFDSDGILKEGADPEAVLEELKDLDLPVLRFSIEVEPWLLTRMQAEESKRLRREYEGKVQSGEWPPQETKVPLFPYQREGMLHLAFGERALLADEMGLGKTIQAIAACALLHRLGKVRRVLVVTPASLKTEWEDQIQKFTGLPYQLVFGQRSQRIDAYRKAPFFTLVNYEQMLRDSLVVNEHLRPDVVVLDEAQRIKNWDTKTAQAVKRLKSRYAFVLTGTPLENRIDELYSIMGFVNPAIFGPLFRFNRDFYELNERGRPAGFKNLKLLHDRIKPRMLRRRKADVETELPERTDRHFFVKLSPAQQDSYASHEAQVARLISLSKKRPLSKQEQDKLMRELAMMRMVCDTNYILDPDDRECPKLVELERILEECRENEGSKAIVFSEWERMLELVRERCGEMGIGYAWHTGSVPQRKRRAEINLFKNDPNCRVFLSTDAGSTGLNLQNADLVINCDLPWNPAKLEQRIARAWRKNQTRPVTVANLVSEGTIEQRMIGTLASKQALADGILDLRGDLAAIKFGGGRQAFFARLEQVLGTAKPLTPARPAAEAKPALPVDRSLAFCERAQQRLPGVLVRCEEQFPKTGSHSVLLAVVEKDVKACASALADVHKSLFGPGLTDPLAPVQLEVMDRATFEALDRLIKAGLIVPGTRAVRDLMEGSSEKAKPSLTPEELQQIKEWEGKRDRKLKMAELLLAGGLEEEARIPLREAVFFEGCVLAQVNHLTQPGSPEEAVMPPILSVWGTFREVVAAFVRANNAPQVPVVEAIRQMALTKAP